MISLVLCFVGAFLISAGLGKPLIARLKKLGVRQSVSEDAPASHVAKQHTPTMGGTLFLFAATIVPLLYLALSPERLDEATVLIPVLIVTLLAGGVGFVDDYLKVTRGKNLGLKARQKLGGQGLIVLLFTLWLLRTPFYNTQVQITPFIRGGAHFVDFGLLYIPLMVLFLVGFSNATNLTDGLDGLSGGVSLTVCLTLTVLLNHSAFPQLGVYTIALAGGLAGFLWWNAHPAKVFMGDVGSLAVGAGLAGVAIISKQEIPFIVASLVCWAEVLSVIIQTSVFKYRKKRHGIEYAREHRVFRRTPLHHHFEELGWAETVVVQRFWLLTWVCCVLAMLWFRA